MLKIASRIAIKATAAASLVTKLLFPGMTPSSMSCFRSNGVAIIKKASITTVIIKKLSDTLYGAAKPTIRLKVPGFNF
ncbi:unannotated protein [freshwater metagenome]|uniref:Unannotated protein n=1 Tax=freshwater metagenome TaxID=449393 RepID=A0A6J6FSU7_9ZZZZ